MERLIKAAVIGASALFLPVTGFADSINPASYDAVLGVGESVTTRITVTVSSNPRSDAKVDVYLLADTTDSMAGVISAVQNSASTILSSTAGLGDVQFAVGEYKDDPSVTDDPYAYRLNTAMTSDTIAVQAGINKWAAGGGGDFPEAILYGLDQATTAATGWRAGSTRILVLFGDAFSHDPSLGVDLATASDDLAAKNIVVEAVDVGYNYNGLDSRGQATAIANATGGDVYAGISSTTVVSTITNAIKSVIDTYSTICLDTSSVPAGVTITTDSCYTGSYNRSTDNTFTFNVTFAGDVLGTYFFPVNVTVDGGIIATQSDRIDVSNAPPSPPPTPTPPSKSCPRKSGHKADRQGHQHEHKREYERGHKYKHKHEREHEHEHEHEHEIEAFKWSGSAMERRRSFFSKRMD